MIELQQLAKAIAELQDGYSDRGIYQDLKDKLNGLGRRDFNIERFLMLLRSEEIAIALRHIREEGNL